MDDKRPGAIARKWQLFEEAKIVITTMPSVEGKTIQEYLGIFTGEAILGAHLGRDITASMRDIVGGRAAEYERVLYTIGFDSVFGDKI